MAVLITGSMGHAGFELVRQSVQRGMAVVAQYRDTFREADAKALGGTVRWVRCDLTDDADLKSLLDGADIDGCIHTAAIPNELYCRPAPLNAVRTNTGAVASLLEAARRRNWRRFIYVSTGSVFQNADTSKPVFEDAQQAVTNVYSTTKYCGELLTSMYRSQFEISAATVRISWVYGPPLVPKERENPRGPIPYFLKCALMGKPVREPSGGDFAASFTHVSDVAGGLLAAYEAPSLGYDAYHLGSGVNYTTRDVVRAIKSAVPDAEIEVGAGTAPWTDHTRMRGPLAGDRLLNDTGWRPRLSLEDGIRSFAEWMRAHPEVLQ
ncbi:MAG TPA: NAD(P)-dependent oxidoreductase [Hyphomicrobiaceae bacterium]